MNSLEAITNQIGLITKADTPAEIAAAIGVLELVAQFLPEPAGRLASEGLLLARDLALAGKSADDMATLRATVRGEWQADLDRRFPNG